MVQSKDRESGDIFLKKTMSPLTEKLTNNQLVMLVDDEQKESESSGLCKLDAKTTNKFS